MKKILLLPILFAFFLISASASSIRQQEVSIYPQPDSPLRLLNAVSTRRVSTDNEGREINMSAVAFVSQNVSDKVIKAYTIRQFQGDFDKDIGAAVSSYFPTSGLLQPNQSYNEQIGESDDETIMIAVDFVEFTDGTVWGKDLSKSAELFAGVRAGMKAGQDYSQKINDKNGIEALVKALDNIKDILPPENRHEKWNRGFRIGLGSVKNRFKQKYEKEGLKGLTAELQKP